MIDSVANNKSKILWQESSEESVPEPAIIIDVYSDTFQMRQRDNSILFNFESIDDLIKILKQLKSDYKK